MQVSCDHDVAVAFGVKRHMRNLSQKLYGCIYVILIYLLVVQVLGDDVDTAESYRKLSELMLRRRLVAPAVAFSRRAVDMLRRLGADSALAEQTAARALYRLQRATTTLDNSTPTTSATSFKPVLAAVRLNTQ